MAKSKQEVAKTVGGEVVPDYLKDYAGEGTELVGDLAIVPRLKLLQGLSPEVIENGEPMGDFYHTVAEVPLGQELTVVPIFISKSVILWRPRKDGGGILARSDDAIHWDRPNMSFDVKLDNGKSVTWNTSDDVQRSGLTEFGSMDPEDPNSHPAATRIINIITMLPEHLDLSPCVISLQRSSFKVGQQFVSKLKISRLPSWSRMFTLESVGDKNANNESYRNWKFTAMIEKTKAGPSPALIGEEYTELYRGMYEHFAQKGFEIKDEEDMQSDESVATESDVF